MTCQLTFIGSCLREKVYQMVARRPENQAGTILPSRLVLPWLREVSSRVTHDGPDNQQAAKNERGKEAHRLIDDRGLSITRT